MKSALGKVRRRSIKKHLKKMTDKTDKTSSRFTIVVDAGDEATAIVRLRQGLKCMLRRFGLRCVSVAPVDDEQQPVHDHESNN